MKSQTDWAVSKAVHTHLHSERFITFFTIPRQHVYYVFKLLYKSSPTLTLTLTVSLMLSLNRSGTVC